MLKKLLKARPLFLAFTLCLCGVGCSEREAVHSGKTVIYASFFAMSDFAERIAGERAEVHRLMPAGVEPHDWEPSSGDVARLANADVFVYNSDETEAWAVRVAESASRGGRLAVVMAGDGLETEGGGARDAHFWLSPVLAKREVQNIARAIIAADPANADYYEANLQAAEADFDALDEEFQNALDRASNRTIVVAHAAYHYLCAEYSLDQFAIEGAAAESEPGPRQIAEAAKFIGDNNIRYIFYDPLEGSKIAQKVAETCGIGILPLDPLESAGDDGEDYFAKMRKNLESLFYGLYSITN